jgi:alpha-1,2-mannosyltransferase
MAALSLGAIFRLIEHGGMPFPPWAKAVVILLSLRPIIGDLTHGNVNVFILFLVIGALFAFHKSHDLLAGLLLALAVCCKVTPLLFAPYFIWKRQWKVLAGWAAGMGLFLFALPAAFLGWHDNLGKLESWAQQMVLPFVRDGVVSSEHPNQSLPGVVHRLLTHSPSFSEYPNGTYTPTEYHNVAELGPNCARWLIRGGQALFALMVVILCRTPVGARGGWRLSLEFSIILLGMLIFSERTWKHHTVTLALPFAALVYALATRHPTMWERAGLLAGMAVAMGLMLGASGMLNTRSADLAQVYGVYLWAFLILLATLAFCATGLQTRQAAMARAAP